MTLAPSHSISIALTEQKRSAVHIVGLAHNYPARRTSPRKNKALNTNIGSSTPSHPALDNINLSIAPGEIFAFLGPNGGGKTTLFRILATLLRPTRGSIELFGDDVLQSPAVTRNHLGVVFQMPSLDGKLSAKENLMHQGHLYGLSGDALRTRINEMLGYFGLLDRADEFVERFSGGMRRRVELAKALLHYPRLLLLDEPSTGLDPGARADLWRHLVKMRDKHGMTIVLTTHFMDEADRCDRIAILSGGKLVATDSPTNLKAAIRGDVITITPQCQDNSSQTTTQELCRLITDRFAPWEPTSPPRIAEEKIFIERPNGAEFIPILLNAFPGKISSITVGQPTLEDVFLNLTGHRLWENQEKVGSS